MKYPNKGFSNVPINIVLSSNILDSSQQVSGSKAQLWQAAKLHEFGPCPLLSMQIGSLKEINKDIMWQKERLKKGEIPYDLYLDFIKDYEEEKKKIVQDLQKGSKGASNPELCVQFAVNYSTKLKPTWASASYSDQQRLQFLLFPEGILYNRAEDKCRTTGVNVAFAYIAELERFLQKCKSRTSLKNFDSAAWVARTRIELVSRV